MLFRSLFTVLTEHGAQAGGGLPADRLAAVQADIAAAFRIAFLTVAAFSATGFFLALLIPLRRI